MWNLNLFQTMAMQSCVGFAIVFNGLFHSQKCLEYLRIFGIETNQTNNLENNDIICTYFIYSSFLLINMFL